MVAALREVFPETGEQRCWFHKIANVLNALPKSAQPGAKAALAEIYNAEDREHAEHAATAFAEAYGAKWPKAVAKITEDLDVLLAFYDYPAEHWVHLRTTNPIESTFATVRLRQGVTKARHQPAGDVLGGELVPTEQRRQLPHGRDDRSAGLNGAEVHHLDEQADETAHARVALDQLRAPLGVIVSVLVGRELAHRGHRGGELLAPDKPVDLAPQLCHAYRPLGRGLGRVQQDPRRGGDGCRRAPQPRQAAQPLLVTAARRLRDQHIRPGWLLELVARLQVRYPAVPIVFADSRKLAEEYTYRYLAAALVHHAPDGTDNGGAPPRS